MTTEPETVESLLRDIRNEMRASNERSMRVVELWSEQRAANKITEEMNAAHHVETLAHLDRTKAIHALELEILQRRAEQERRWDKPSGAIKGLGASVDSISELIETARDKP